MTLSDIVKSSIKIFDFDYPCVAGYREDFEKKFFYEYHDREINFLSVNQFKEHLASKLNLIMPYYVQLQLSENLIHNPFENYKMVESRRRADDRKSFYKSIDTALYYDKSNSRNEQNTDLLLNQNVVYGGTGTTDGTLNSKTNGTTQDHSVTVLNGKEVTDRDTSDTKDTTRNLNTEKDISIDEKITTDYEHDANTKTNESGNSSKTTNFSDTPQVNFQVAEVDEKGNVISQYATTVTMENEKYSKEGNTNLSESSTENKNRTENDKTTENVDETINEKQNGNLNQTVATNNTSTTDSNGLTTGTKDDTNHGSYEDNSTTITNANTNEKINGQQVSDKNGTSSSNRAGDRTELTAEEELYAYAGYKQESISNLLKSFRETFLNIDMDILRECEVLFIGLY